MLLQDADIAVSDQAFAYLRLQRGRIADLADDRAAWEAAYNRELTETYHQIAPFLPTPCARILDIGSGLGGIDILLSRHYGGAAAIWLLDGHADAPVFERHDRTFSSMRAARAHLATHGVRVSGQWGPDVSAKHFAEDAFDLIVSFQAWGFHIEPEAYLDFVAARLAPGGRLILDFRTGRPAWRGALLDQFVCVGVAAVADKYERLVFEQR